MNPSNLPPLKPVATDQDLAEQARPGHGIPSQDPDIAAQVSLEPWEAEREANSVLAGGGMMVGAAAGGVRGWRWVRHRGLRLTRLWRRTPVSQGW